MPRYRPESEKSWKGSSLKSLKSLAELMRHSLKAKNKRPIFEELWDLVRVDVERVEGDLDSFIFLQQRGDRAKVPKWIVLDGVEMEFSPDFGDWGATIGNYGPTNKEKVPMAMKRNYFTGQGSDEGRIERPQLAFKPKPPPKPNKTTTNDSNPIQRPTMTENTTATSQTPQQQSTPPKNTPIRPPQPPREPPIDVNAQPTTAAASTLASTQAEAPPAAASENTTELPSNANTTTPAQPPTPQKSNLSPKLKKKKTISTI